VRSVTIPVARELPVTPVVDLVDFAVDLLLTVDLVDPAVDFPDLTLDVLNLVTVTVLVVVRRVLREVVLVRVLMMVLVLVRGIGQQVDVLAPPDLVKTVFLGQAWQRGARGSKSRCFTLVTNFVDFFVVVVALPVFAVTKTVRVVVSKFKVVVTVADHFLVRVKTRWQQPCDG
jgi:hypothetical protein